MFRKRKVEQELDDELRAYVELQAAQKVRRGMSPEDALREARRELGGMDQVKENVRDVRPRAFMDTLVQHIRYPSRTPQRNHAFAFFATLPLPFATRPTTSIFYL